MFLHCLSGNLLERSCGVDNLREFVFANERHPESVRVFPWLRPAAGDSGSGELRGAPRNPQTSFQNARYL